MMSSDKWIQWIKDNIAKNYINYYNYSEFQDIECIGTGGFSKVYRATLESSNTIVALKYLKNNKNNSNNSIMKEIVNELELLHEVSSHTNIIKFFGITKREKKGIENYLLVLEHADSGTLRDYLGDNFSKLDWNIKLQFAIQIADAISCIHQKDIIHRDLHSNNILVHRNVIKLADFGLSRRIAEISNSPRNIFGTLPYVDPQYFNEQTNSNGHYKANKKSDVYGVGVLLWEISSGQKPFKSYDKYHRKPKLMLDILGGKREASIYGTPIDYINIYTECWRDNPDSRPDMQQVLSRLKLIRSWFLFSMEIDRTIRERMKEYNHLLNPYIIIQKEIPQYTSSQIRKRWKSKLDPRLCHDPLDEDEKSFITNWVEINRTPGGKIFWRDLVNKINLTFGKLHSESKIRNFWYKKNNSSLRSPYRNFMLEA